MNDIVGLSRMELSILDSLSLTHWGLFFMINYYNKELRKRVYLRKLINKLKPKFNKQHK